MRGILLYSQFYDFDKKRHRIGGVETYLRNLCGVIRAAGIDPLVVFSDNQERRGVVDDVQLVGVRATNKWKTDLLVKAEEVGDPKEDLLLFGSSTLISSSKFVHSIAIQHGIYWDTTDFKGSRLTGDRALLARMMQARRQLHLHSLVSRMVCVDLNYVNWMRALSVDNRLPYIYIPNFADTTSAVSKRRNDGIVRVVFARRFEAIRGCRLLMDVMPRAMSKHPEIELTIAGAGSMEAELREKFGRDPRVTFTSYDASESVSFHSQFDIALVPSMASEGTSLSLLEAMAARCAVVATDVGGMSNIVLSGHNGLLVRPEADDLYSAVSTLADNPGLRDRLALNARQTVVEAFSRDRWAESWARVLKEYM